MKDGKEETKVKKTKVIRSVITDQMKRQYVRKRSEKKDAEKESAPTYAVKEMETAAENIVYDGVRVAKGAMGYGKKKLIQEMQIKKVEIKQKAVSFYDARTTLSLADESSKRNRTVPYHQQRSIKLLSKGKADSGKQMITQRQKSSQQNTTDMEQWQARLRGKMQQKFREQAAYQQGKQGKSLIRVLLLFEKIITAKAKQMTSTLFVSGGIMVLVIMVLLFGTVSALVASPFGVLFANEDTTADTMAISQVVAALNSDFAEQVEEIIERNPHDSMTVNGDMADWTDVIAIFAVRTAGRDDNMAMDVVTIDRDRQEKIKEVFNDMNVLSYDVEVIRHGRGENSWTERILHITIEPKTTDQMTDIYGFTEGQREILAELLEERPLLQSLVGSLTVSTVEARNVLRNLPEELSAERRAVIESAMQLVGKVNYFWGGKSSAIGWDNRWGLPTKVMAEGSSTTGKIRAYGLDCSGYVDWVFHNSLDYIVGQGGGAASQHRNCYSISWDNAEIGDLVFYADDSHVGIVAGWDSDGEILIVHCSAGYNNVVITGKEGFSSVGRPRIYE